MLGIPSHQLQMAVYIAGSQGPWRWTAENLEELRQAQSAEN